MPNHFFKFRKFTVHQEWSAMKVCTEACLFGAWLADILKGKAGHIIGSALDIGAGTGLLSLMIAQNSEFKIDAVEIDSNAAREAGSNFSDSPWNNKLKIFNIPVQEYSETRPMYDLVFSNPPFFNNDLKGPDEKRNTALHDGFLSIKELLSAAEKMVAPECYFALILPYHRSEYFESLIQKSVFKIEKKANVKQTGRHSIFRSMYFLCRTGKEIIAESEEIIIKEGEIYSARFQHLLRDYYLNIS